MEAVQAKATALVQGMKGGGLHTFDRPEIAGAR